MMRLVAIVVFVCLSFQLSILKADVWSVNKNWTAEWEHKYSQWVSENWDVDFFIREQNPFAGLLVDCADASYTMRIVFSSIHGLPFAVTDSTGGANKISQEMKRWDHLPEIERVRNFLTLIYQVTNTQTLPNDTYLVSLSDHGIRPGGILLASRIYGHTWTIKNLSIYGVPLLVYSSVPARNTLLSFLGFPAVDLLFPEEQSRGDAGFRAFRWPEYVGMPAWRVPGYSNEQHGIPTETWSLEVQKRVAFKQESDNERMERLLGGACQLAQDRVTFVNEALRYLEQIQFRCMDSAEFDLYSTPHRDERLEQAMKEIESTYQQIKKQKGGLSLEVEMKISTVLLDFNPSLTEAQMREAYCPVEYTPGHVVSLGFIRDRARRALLSSNPHNSIEGRWGLTYTLNDLSARCPNYGLD